MLCRLGRIFSLCALSLATPLPALAAKPEPTPLQETMHGIFANLKVVYAAALQPKFFADEKNKPALLSNFEKLRTLALEIKGHGGEDDTFDFTGESLAKDTAQALAMYQQKSYAESAFTLRHMTENCLSCHLRAQSKAAFPADFISADLQKQLNPYELARLKTATRNFAQAQSAYEGLILAPKYSFEELLGSGILIDYLKLMIKLEHNFQAPSAVLNKLSKLKGQSNDAKTLVALWQKDLKKLHTDKYFKDPASLQQARELVAAASQHKKNPLFPTTGLVAYITASASLQDFVFAQTPTRLEKAQAYKLLGGLENMLEQSFWLNEAQHYWESAIRFAPHSALAQEAYQDLEAKVSEGFTGSAGTQIPADVQDWLTNLKSLSAPAPTNGTTSG